jgi:hypothetical protein
LEDAGFSWRSLIDLQQTVAQPSPGSATARKRQKKASGYDSRRSRNNENDTHVAINGATNEDQSPGSGPFIADLLQIRGNAYAICQAEDLREVTRETTYCCS